MAEPSSSTTWTSNAGGTGGTHPPQPVAEAMHAAWVAFATVGIPAGHRSSFHEGRQCFDTTPKVVEDPRSTERVLWARLR